MDAGAHTTTYAGAEAAEAQPRRLARAGHVPVPQEDWLHHFGLVQAPFEAEPDERFHVELASGARVLEAMLSALGAAQALVKVTGVVGAGKTLLCRRLLAAAGPGFRCVCIDSPSLTPLAFLQALAEQLGVHAPVPAGTASQHSQQRLLLALRERLQALGAAGRRVLVCVDGAQDMPPQTLQALHHVMELGGGPHERPCVALFGEDELDELLAHPAARPLVRHLAGAWRLGRLGPRALSRYLAQRMAVAGHGGAPVFGAAARWLLLARTRGLPGRVNRVAQQALRRAAARGAERVGLCDTWQAIADTSGAWACLPRLALAGLGVGCLGLLLSPPG